LQAECLKRLAQMRPFLAAAALWIFPIFTRLTADRDRCPLEAGMAVALKECMKSSPPCSALRRFGLSLWLALTLLLLAGPAAHAIVLAWDPNEEPDVTGYRVHYGTASGQYSEIIDVGNATSAPIEDLLPGTTYFFAVTAYNSLNVESLPSDEIAYSAPGLAPLVRKGRFRGAGEMGESLTHLRLFIAKNGRFSGKLFVRGSTAVVRGKLGASGQQTLELTTRSGLAATVSLQADASGAIAATITIDGESATLALPVRALPSATPSPHAGNYTLLLGSAASLDASSQAPVPDFSGSAVLKITKSGVVRAVGKLADGTNFALVSAVGPDGEIAFGTPLPAPARGLLSGNLFLRDNENISDGDGTFGWRKPASVARAGVFPDGFEVRMPALLSRFSPPQGLFNPTVDATLSGGELPAELDPIQKSIALPAAGPGTALPLGEDRLRITIARGNGLVKGNFVHPADGKLRGLRGVWFQKQNAAFGAFKGVSTSGTFAITSLNAPASP